jgi:hypothetical protein
LDPYPLVRGTDPGIRILTKMSRIPNTEKNNEKIYVVTLYLQGSRRGAAGEVAFRVGFPGHAVRTDGWKERYNLSQLGLEQKSKSKGKNSDSNLKKLTYSQKNALQFSGLRIRIISIWIRIQLFNLMRIRILLLIKVMGICDHWSVDPTGLNFDPPGLHCELAWPSTALY